MAVPAIIASGVSIIQGVQAISGGNAKDPERLQRNADAYQRALQGDQNALLFLKHMSGDYGTANIPGYGTAGGWATPGPKADAKAKYEALQRAATVSSGIASVGTQVKEVIEDATGAKIVAITKDQQQLLLVGALVVAAFFIVPRLLPR